MAAALSMPSIKIFGRGLNDEKTNYTDILARAVALNAKLHAQRLQLITGANTIPVNAAGAESAHHLAAPQPLKADNNKPLFALDVAAIGGLYAKHIYLIGSEAGLGVRTAVGSELYSRGEFTLTSAGEIVHRGAIKAAHNAQIHATENITNQAEAQITAQGNLSMRSQASITNQGVMAATGNVELIADSADSSITSTAGSSLLAGISDKGTLTDHGAHLHLSAHKNTSLHGTHLASDQLTVTSAAIAIGGGQTQAAHLRLSGSPGQHAQTIDINGGTLHATKQLQLNSAHLSGAGQLTSAGDINIALHHDYTHTGNISAKHNLTLHTAGSLINQGRLHAQRHLSLSAANLDNQARAEIAAATSLELSLAQQLQNRGLITAPSALINASTLHNLGTG